MSLNFSDTETYGDRDLRKCGTHAYAETVEVMLWAYARDDGEVAVWDLTTGAPMPAELEEDLADPEVIFVFHNAPFDLVVLRHALGIDLPIERVRCTMAQALAHGLPGALDKLCGIFNLGADEAKDKRGKELVQLFCKPRPKNHKLRRATRETHPQEWAQFASYAGSDIKASRALHKRMPSWNYRDGELRLWQLDQRINRRGFLVDTTLARAAINAVNSAQATLAADTVSLTGGRVDAATQRDKLLKYIVEEHGVDLPDMKASTIEKLVGDEALPKTVRDLLAIRLQASSSSTAKYQKLLDAVSSDGRLRGTLQFCGASRTGRWAGRVFQPQNLPRIVLEAIAAYFNLAEIKQVKEHHVVTYLEQGIAALKAGVADLLFVNVMALCVNAIRGCIIAPEGKKICVSDLANIEGRDAAWLAGEQWKLDAFREYDAGTGPDLYKLAYAKAFNISPDAVTKDQRQVGKVLELFMQYEGGVGAFITGALTYGIDLDQLAEVAWPSVPEHIRGEAAGAWDWAEKKHRSYGLERKTYMVCDSLKRMWREAHPEIASYWAELKTAARAAIVQNGVTVPCRKLKFRRDGAWLRMVLPSGRAICYASPKVEGDKITYLGVNSYTRQWSRIGTYGGKFFENACQAVARDVMAHNMPMIERCGYEIVLSVHDELLTEAPDNDDYSSDELSMLLATVPPWGGNDLPLAAGGFEAYRYRKD